MAQFRDLAAFAQFGAEQLDKVPQAQLARGQRLTEVLKQDQYSPLAIEKQVFMIFAGTSGAMDNIPPAQCRRFESELLSFMDTKYSGLLKQIPEKKSLDDALRAELGKAIDAFK